MIFQLHSIRIFAPENVKDVKDFEENWPTTVPYQSTYIRKNWHF